MICLLKVHLKINHKHHNLLLKIHHTSLFLLQRHILLVWFIENTKNLIIFMILSSIFLIWIKVFQNYFYIYHYSKICMFTSIGKKLLLRLFGWRDEGYCEKLQCFSPVYLEMYTIVFLMNYEYDSSPSLSILVMIIGCSFHLISTKTKCWIFVAWTLVFKFNSLCMQYILNDFWMHLFMI